MSVIVSSAATYAALSAPRARVSSRKALGGVQLPSASKAAIALDRASSRRGARLVVRAEEGGLPDFVKDLMKPPDASIAAPGWLAPVINLAEEAGEDAPVVGYGIMGATGVFLGLIMVVAVGGFGFFLALAGTGYACWQASPYLSAIGDKFDKPPAQPPSMDSTDEE